MNERSPAGKALPPWKVLIADDDRDVHEATRMALRGIRFCERTLDYVDAYSGAETLAALQENPDIAIVFLDVIMETEDAGLAVVRRIREAGFKLVRIIIRTGFPGQAPERQVIVDYDIHDYKEKTGLSVQKLFTSVISALRAYDDLKSLERHRRGLMSVLESVSWFDFNAVQRYVSGMLAEFSDLARLQSQHLVILCRPTAQSAEMPTVIASLGEWQGEREPDCIDDLPPATSALIGESFSTLQALSGAAGVTRFFRNHGIDLVVCASGDEAFAGADDVFLEVFLSKVCQAISNQQTFSEMVSVRDALLHAMAVRADRWKAGAAVELERLSSLVSALALQLNSALSFPGEIDEAFVRDIGVAVRLHDLGNESLPESLLRKLGSFDADERRLMQSHVEAGMAALDQLLLGTCHSNVFDLARSITASHHEHLDGSGYPHALRGATIPLAARIVAVADAFVAMTSLRPHRPALMPSAVCAEIEAAAGTLYDPRIVEALLDVVDRGVGKQ